MTVYRSTELLLTVVLPASYLRPKTKLQNTFTAENETGRNYQNLSFSAPKTKTNFGRSLISEMVEDRWVHAAMRLTSIEFSFDPCNIYRDGPRGVGYPADARSIHNTKTQINSHILYYVLFVVCITRTLVIYLKTT